MEGVVILEDKEDLLEKDADLDSGSRIQDVPGSVSQDVDPPGMRLFSGDSGQRGLEFSLMMKS